MSINMDSYKPSVINGGTDSPLAVVNAQKQSASLPGYPALSSTLPFAMSPSGFQPGSPYAQMPSGGPMGDLTFMMSQVMQLFMMTFTGGMGILGPSGKGGQEEPVPGGEPEEELPPEDPHLKAIQGEDPKSNSGALAILDEYASKLPAKNGKVKLSDLKKFVKSPPEDVPEEVVQAAKTLTENDGLYDLLCAKSNSTADKGFKLQTLGTDWSKTKTDIDNLEGVDDDVEAITILKKNVFKTGYSYNMDHIEDIAFGKPNGDAWSQKIPSSKFKDPEVQAAALRIVVNPDLFEALDVAGTPSGESDESFNLDAVNAWLKENK